MKKFALAAVIAAAQVVAYAAAPSNDDAVQFTAAGKLVPPAGLQTGTWPDGSLFVLEVRESLAVGNSASGSNGYFQGGITGIEAQVKDSQRFAGQWAFFNLGKGTEGAQVPEQF